MNLVPSIYASSNDSGLITVEVTNGWVSPDDGWSTDPSIYKEKIVLHTAPGSITKTSVSENRRYSMCDGQRSETRFETNIIRYIRKHFNFETHQPDGYRLESPIMKPTTVAIPVADLISILEKDADGNGKTLKFESSSGSDTVYYHTEVTGGWDWGDWE